MVTLLNNFENRSSQQFNFKGDYLIKEAVADPRGDPGEATNFPKTLWTTKDFSLINYQKLVHNTSKKY